MTDLDITTLSYAGMVSRLSLSEKAYFLFVCRELEIPQKLLKEYPNFLEPLDEYAGNEMKEEIQHSFDGHPDIEEKIEVLQGNPLQQLLQYAVKKQIDLIVVGRKKDASETRRLPLKLARKASCSVMVLPHQSKTAISKILVPIDFSKNSADAMDVGIAFAAAAGITEIICLHVYSLPLGFYKTGKSEEEFAEIMRRNAEGDYTDFIKQINLKGLSVAPRFVLAKKTVKAICDTVNREGINLIAIGSRGRSNAAAVLLGSITEKLIMRTNIPIIAVKKKGANMKFLEAILKI
ncbi:MAG: universal stress protein [Prolixibacteraceae bacterium]|nr:universal stress protein [Prolixibacteraceae bacterium]